ncbi:MAG: ATP-binding protein [Holophaga sp.]|nr:ATP-binding protein [Holophaga sp.]
MIARAASETLMRLARGFPILAITGPRQSGKTTLAKAAFAGKPYLSLEDPDLRDLAETDPRGLLSRFPEGAILDEVQRAPNLFSYLQTQVDEKLRPGSFVLTGSQQFGLLSGITQTLAGRVGLVQLLPFSMGELREAGRLPGDLDEFLLRGSYPPLYDRDLAPADWHGNYISTYVERDVRQLIALRDLSAFQRFIRLCAARVGQLLNLSSLAADCGVSHNTASAWLSVLEASYIVFLLRPHFSNFSKRLVKAPKLYFCDTGLAGWLLGIREPAQMAFHALRGSLFENLVVTDFLKARLNQGVPPDLHFWRDSRGLEVDLVVEKDGGIQPIEVKSGRTIAPDFFDSLGRWNALAGRTGGASWLVYGGESALRHGGVEVVPWKGLPELEGRL